MRFALHAAVLFSAATVLGGCSVPDLLASGETVIEEPRPRGVPEGRVGDVVGPGGVFGRPGADGGGAGVSVNRHLWLAALDTLSFMPLSSTDPFSGVIATDWSTSADAPDERLKVTVYISNHSLAANSLRVAVFREVRGPSGAWLSADVADATPRRLEDAILTRARQLRVTELEASRRRG